MSSIKQWAAPPRNETCLDFEIGTQPSPLGLTTGQYFAGIRLKRHANWMRMQLRSIVKTNVKLIVFNLLCGPMVPVPLGMDLGPRPAAAAKGTNSDASVSLAVQ